MHIGALKSLRDFEVSASGLDRRPEHGSPFVVVSEESAEFKAAIVPFVRHSSPIVRLPPSSLYKLSEQARILLLTCSPPFTALRIHQPAFPRNRLHHLHPPCLLRTLLLLWIPSIFQTTSSTEYSSSQSPAPMRNQSTTSLWSLSITTLRPATSSALSHDDGSGRSAHISSLHDLARTYHLIISTFVRD